MSKGRPQTTGRYKTRSEYELKCWKYRAQGMTLEQVAARTGTARRTVVAVLKSLELGGNKS